MVGWRCCWHVDVRDARARDRDDPPPLATGRMQTDVTTSDSRGRPSATPFPSATAFLFACGLAQALHLSSATPMRRHVNSPRVAPTRVHVKVACDSEPSHIERIRRIDPSVRLFHDARAMNDSIESNEVSAASLHCDIFESGADCRSRSPMRLLNRGISRGAETAHSLWFEQFRTIRLTRPKTVIIECAPPDTDTELDYQQGVEILEELGYAVTVCTRFPSDLCGDAVHKDRFYALASLSPIKLNMLDALIVEHKPFTECLLPLGDVPDELWVDRASERFIPFNRAGPPTYSLENMSWQSLKNYHQ